MFCRRKYHLWLIQYTTWWSDTVFRGTEHVNEIICLTGCNFWLLKSIMIIPTSVLLLRWWNRRWDAMVQCPSVSYICWNVCRLLTYKMRRSVWLQCKLFHLKSMMQYWAYSIIAPDRHKYCLFIAHHRLLRVLFVRCTTQAVVLTLCALHVFLFFTASRPALGPT
jgi:hypothetical protein